MARTSPCVPTPAETLAAASPGRRCALAAASGAAPHEPAAAALLTTIALVATLTASLTLANAAHAAAPSATSPAAASDATPSPAVAAPAASAPAAPLSEDCFDELENGRTAEIACLFPLRLSDSERTELEKGSRGYVRDVTCTLTVRVPRATVATAIAARDHVFESPEQPVVCTVTTHKSTFDVTATFAPRVVFRNDVAVEASPGLANVKGVSRVLSWPVVQFVNRWPSIRKGLMQVVDAYRLHARTRADRAPRP